MSDTSDTVSPRSPYTRGELLIIHRFIGQLPLCERGIPPPVVGSLTKTTGAANRITGARSVQDLVAVQSDRALRNESPLGRSARPRVGPLRHRCTVWHAGAHGRDGGSLRSGFRADADRLDRGERHLPLPTHQREGRV